MAVRFSRPDGRDRDRDRDDLFSTYNRSASPSKSKSKAARSPYGYSSPGASPALSFGAYPGAGAGSLGGGRVVSGGGGGGVGGGGGDYRSATPNSRGQYSSAVLDELESQNEEQVGVLTTKVKMLKDVCVFFSPFFFLGGLIR